MKITSRNEGRYHSVEGRHDGTIISLGFLDDQGRDELAVELLEGIYELSPSDFDAWFTKILEKAGIEFEQQKQEE